MINKVNITRTIILLIFLVVWQILGNLSSNIFFFIGTPIAIIQEFINLVITDRLYFHFLLTGSEAVLGLIIGTLLGTIVGLFLWFSDDVNQMAKPFIISLGTLPVFAFAPLMIVWFGIGFSMKVAMATFSTVFVAFNQANKGAKSVSNDYIDMLKGMGAKPRQIFKIVIIPGSIDWVLSSMKLNVGFSLLGAFIGEFISSNNGLGYLILRAGNLYNIPRAFAAAIGIIILALLLDSVAGLIENNRNKIIQIISINPKLWIKHKIKFIIS